MGGGSAGIGRERRYRLDGAKKGAIKADDVRAG